MRPDILRDDKSIDVGENRYVYRGRRINVKLSVISLPDGVCVRKEIVEHPGAVVILPLLDDKVILIRQFRISVNEWLYELPAGTLDKKGESLEDCARRELKEETGYVAGSVRELFKLYPSPGFCTEVIHSFAAQDLRKDVASPEQGEMIQPIILSLDDAIALVKNQKIIDAKTIATLLYYERFIREG
ncbi:MAG: NUDIX hydrolase [Nitrososphaeria archaeon]